VVVGRHHRGAAPALPGGSRIADLGLILLAIGLFAVLALVVRGVERL